MRHHFTKSERLALQLILHLGYELISMRSWSIQRGRWTPLSRKHTRQRSVSRVVTFGVEDWPSRKVAGVQVQLIGWEKERPTPEGTSRRTTWKITGVVVGYRTTEGVAWKQLHIPDYSEDPAAYDQFPHHLFIPVCVGAVPSTDA